MTNSAAAHQVVTMNMHDGSVQGHAAGCADLKRGIRKFSQPTEADYPMTVATKHEVWVDYNQDFLAEGEESGTYSIQWLPCAKAVPQGTEDTYEAWVAENTDDEAPATVVTLAKTAAPVITTKTGPKWAYVYVDGTQVAEVRSTFLAPVLAAITAEYA